MKRRINKISLMIALLMVVSTFSIGANGTESEVDVIKKVWDPGEEEWVKWVEAEFGEEVQFRINITYYNNIGGTHYAWHINVTDTLPSILEYVDGSAQFSVEPVETGKSEDGKTIWWYFGDYKLPDKETITILFNATVVDYGEEDNVVGVYAEEWCNENEQMEDRDYATVYVEEPPEPEPLDFDKKVWNPEEQEWVENLPEVRKDTPVRFQITLTYQGEYTMKCLLVGDLLPEECLEYANNVYIKIAGEEIKEGDPRYPDIVVGEDATIKICGEEINVSEIEELIELFAGYEGDIIFWDWRDADFALHEGESVIIEFDANVTQYCECTVTNGAFALLWGCYLCDSCNYCWGCDTANVTCIPPDPIFEKKVWNGNEWVENTSAFVGDTVRFKIELTYYGESTLSDIKIVDKLPCILEYANNANIEESNVSGDKKTIWWNLTIDLNDSETLTIEFDALVTGVSDCPDCGRNVATYTALECGTQTEYTGEDDAKVTSTHRPPVELDIRIKRFSLGRVNAYIKNVGEEDVSDVEWSINVKKGGVLYRWERGRGSSIDLIEAGKSAEISTGSRSILRKFGRVTITVTATVGEETFTETAKGFVFGRIILVRPLIRFGR